MMSEPQGRVLPILALASAGSLWGTGFYFGKIALNEMPVATMILFRLAFTCVGLAPAFLFERPRFVRSELGWLFAASLLGVPVLFLVQFKGLSLTNVSHAALMVGTLPMLLAVAAMVFSGERLYVGGWLALGASTIGAGLIAVSNRQASGTEHPTARGDLLVVLSLFAAISWMLISKRLMNRHSPLMVTASVFFIGTVLLAIIVPVAFGVPSLHYSARAWIAVAEQGLFATACATVLWNWGLKRVPVSHAGIFVNLEPLVGAILGVSLLHEALGRMALAGGALIMAGAVYFSYQPRRAG